jgi:thymidine kinase
MDARHGGEIQIIVGPMFSGKSTELMRRIRRYGFAKKKCLVCKYDKDQRYGTKEEMATHDRVKMLALPCSVLADAADTYMDFDVIGIDEGQFFGDLVSFCETAANNGKIVIVAGLDGDFKAAPFGTICDLLPLAEKFDKICAVCAVSGCDAAFTRRNTSDTAVELIGGAETYDATCRAWHRSNGPLSIEGDDAASASRPSVSPPSTDKKAYEDEFGEVQLIVGPMFSGKSSELMRRLRRYRHSRQRSLLVKHSKNARYTANKCTLATHDKLTMVAHECANLSEIPEDLLRDVDVIGIDEGQFFPDIASFCDEAANSGKIVIVAALDGTFERKAYKHISDMVPMAEKIDKLCAVCAVCGSDAAFTRRLGPAKVVELVGGSELYLPVCRGCHHHEGLVESPTTSPRMGSSLLAESPSVRVRVLPASAKDMSTDSPTSVVAPGIFSPITPLDKRALF